MGFRESITQAVTQLWTDLAVALPEIVGAIVIFVIGLIIAPMFGSIARRVVSMVRIDQLAEKMGLASTLKSHGLDFSFANLIGGLVKWFFLIAFLIAATDILGWTRVTEFLSEIVLYIPNVVVAVIILAVGFIVGQFVSDVVTKGLNASNAPIKNKELIAKVAKWALVTFAVFAALLQLGIAESLIQILFAGVVAALALAFGLGGREKAAKLLDSIDASK